MLVLVVSASRTFADAVSSSRSYNAFVTDFIGALNSSSYLTAKMSCDDSFTGSNPRTARDKKKEVHCFSSKLVICFCTFIVIIIYLPSDTLEIRNIEKNAKESSEYFSTARDQTTGLLQAIQCSRILR